MRLLEMFDHVIPGYQDIEDDHSNPMWRESRKSKLTLKQIRKLRKMNDVRNYERSKYLVKIKEQYGTSPAEQPSV